MKQIKTAADVKVRCSSMHYVTLQTRVICYQTWDDNVVFFFVFVFKLLLIVILIRAVFTQNGVKARSKM